MKRTRARWLSLECGSRRHAQLWGGTSQTTRVPFRLPTPLTFKPDELYRVATADGSAIALGRYRPRGERRFTEPVVLAHSLATNRFNLDFDERYSVARGLAYRGFETWVLEVRGHGLGGSGAGSTFDLEATLDVSAALQAILSTGAERVHWLGHSRGGLLALAHLARNPQAPIASLVAVGTPVSFAFQGALRGFVNAVTPALRLDPVPLALPAKLAVPLGLPPAPFGSAMLNADNVDAEVIRQALAYVVADLPLGVAQQFARWVQRGVFDGNDGFDYRHALTALQLPILAVAGAVDSLAPPAAVHEIRALVRGHVECLTAGRSSGFSADYGHGDLVLGRRAPDEILPKISDFLARNAQ